MTIPTVTELRRHLQPTTPDPFRDFEPVIRELDRRHNDGIDVRLLWNQTDDQIVVSVLDAKTGDAFTIDVEAREALDAFRHPYAHLAC
jgi:phage-related protein